MKTTAYYTYVLEKTFYSLATSTCTGFNFSIHQYYYYSNTALTLHPMLLLTGQNKTFNASRG